jgi:PAS domain S-box-containing protein
MLRGSTLLLRMPMNSRTPISLDGQTRLPPSELDRATFPWQLVLENTIVGISYMQDRRFLWANARMAEIFGFAPGELDGQVVRRLYATQEDYNDVGRLMAQARSDRFVTHERAMACKDGRLIWCRISGRMLREGDARMSSVWVVQDLSDKKRAEDELRRINQRLEDIVERRTVNLQRTNAALKAEIERGRELRQAAVASREKYRTLFTNMPLGVLVVGADGMPTEANRTLRTYLGATTRDQLHGLIHEDARVLRSDGTTCSLATIVGEHCGGDQPRVQRFEFSWLGRASRRREISAVAAPLGASRGAVFTFADVSEQHRRRQQEHREQETLAHASRLSLMGQMASALAHELGQPLNTCQSYLSGLRHRLDPLLVDQPELLQALDRACDQLVQAGQIIRNVRDFVSKPAPMFEAIKLEPLLRQTLALLELPLRTAQVQTVLSPTPDSVLVRGHSVEIQQVVVNLIVNAIEAMKETPPASRKIEIRTSADGRLATVEVADTGCGVSPDIAGRMFDPYVTSKRSGLGMGLMISRMIVESHGGSLRHVRQRATGATFRFTLPLAAPV